MSQARAEVRCVETGAGSKGSVFVCETPVGDVGVRVLKTSAPYLWTVYTEYPFKKYTTMRALNRNRLRKYIEEWIAYILKHER